MLFTNSLYSLIWLLIMIISVYFVFLFKDKEDEQYHRRPRYKHLRVVFWILRIANMLLLPFR